MWFEAYPQARSYGVCEAHLELPFTDVLTDKPPAEWKDAFDQHLVSVNEIAFSYPTSNSAILTDPGFNFATRCMLTDGRHLQSSLRRIPSAAPLSRRQSGCSTSYRLNSRLGLRTPDRRSRPALRNTGQSRHSTGLRLLVSLEHRPSHIASLDPPHQRANAQRQADAKIGYPPETRDDLLTIKGCPISVNLKKRPSR